MRYSSSLAILTIITASLTFFTAASICSAEDADQMPSTEEFVKVDTHPELLTAAKPVYPPEALKQGVEGKVYIRSLVDKNGDPVKVEVLKSSGSDLLDKAALAAAKKAEFKPALLNGQPVAIWVANAFTFKEGECSSESKPKTSDIPDENSFVALDKIPEVIHQENPIYPPEAEKKGIEGVVRINAFIGKDGVPGKILVDKSSGNKLLDEAAAEAAGKMRYKPAQKDGQPVASWISYDITFKL
jgi:TonB family protein